MAEEKAVKYWKAPSYHSKDEKAKLDFVMQNVQDGERYYENSPAYQQLQESIRILTGTPSAALASKQEKSGYSKLHTARLRRNLREMVNALADIRFTPGYHSDANEYQMTSATLNRVAASWYSDRFIDVKIKRGIQWMSITTCTYLELMYRTFPGERDRQDIDLVPHSAFDVVCTGVPQDGDLQECYTVTIKRDLPIYLSHSMWPKFTEYLVPDRETPSGWMEKVSNIISDVFDNRPVKQTAKNPTVRLYYQFVLDLSVNKTGHTITMGLDPNTGQRTSWTYEVPSVGEKILAGYDSNGTEMYRIATEKDCRLFPGRRLMVATENKLIYDGPFWDWHGQVPLVKMSADSEPFGDFSMIYDVANLQDTINEMERMIHQTARNKRNPSFLYNNRAMARSTASALRTEVTGQRIGYNGAEGNDPAKPAFPQWFYEVGEWEPEIVKYLMEQMDYQMGVQDISNLAKAKMTANGDQMEKLMSMSGPIVKGISREMERAMRDIAEMFKYLVFQYYTTPKIMQIVGIDGITPENFDFDPGNLVPSHLPGEITAKPSIHTRRQRAHWIADHVTFFITPNTLHQVTQMTQKMIYMQLWRQGFPIDPWTLAEIFNIGDFGKKPEGTNDIMSRWLAWQKMQLEMKAQMADEERTLAGAMGAQPNAPGTGPNGGHKGTGGRAPSGQTAPHITPGNMSRGPRVRETR